MEQDSQRHSTFVWYVVVSILFSYYIYYSLLYQIELYYIMCFWYYIILLTYYLILYCSIPLAGLFSSKLRQEKSSYDNENWPNQPVAHMAAQPLPTPLTDKPLGCPNFGWILATSGMFFPFFSKNSWRRSWDFFLEAIHASYAMMFWILSKII